MDVSIITVLSFSQSDADSMAAASGMRPEIMQKIIGHVDYSTTTDFYIATYIEDLAKAMSQIK